MSSEKELYDPHVTERTAYPEPTGPSPREGRTKTEIVQEQIDTTKGSIQKTLQELGNRGQKLEELEEATVMLSDSASAFKVQTVKVRKDIWWKNAKMTVILTITILLILAAIIVPIVLKFQGKI